MQIVLDSVSLSRLLRKPKKTRHSNGVGSRLGTSLDEYMSGGILQVALDSDNGVLAEWERTCGEDLVRQLINHWDELSGLFLVSPRSSLAPITKQLRNLGFSDTIDKLLVRIATETRDKIIVSNDSDFWDPGRANSIGNQTAVVAVLLRDIFDVQVILLAQLLARLKA